MSGGGVKRENLKRPLLPLLSLPHHHLHPFSLYTLIVKLWPSPPRPRLSRTHVPRTMRLSPIIAAATVFAMVVSARNAVNVKLPTDNNVVDHYSSDAVVSSLDAIAVSWSAALGDDV